MSRYTCHKCRDEHGTDNVVAYCAPCYSGIEKRLKEAETTAAAKAPAAKALVASPEESND